MLQGFSKLDGAQLRKCRELVGQSTSQFARSLGLAGGGKAVVDLERGKRPISGPVARSALTMAGGWPYLSPEPALFRFTDPDDDRQLVAFFDSIAGEDFA